MQKLLHWQGKREQKEIIQNISSKKKDKWREFDSFFPLNQVAESKILKKMK